MSNFISSWKCLLLFKKVLEKVSKKGVGCYVCMGFYEYVYIDKCKCA